MTDATETVSEVNPEKAAYEAAIANVVELTDRLTRVCNMSEACKNNEVNLLILINPKFVGAQAHNCYMQGNSETIHLMTSMTQAKIVQQALEQQAADVSKKPEGVTVQ